MSGESLLLHAIEQYQPSHVFALFSGGHDSLCATHSAMQTGKVDAVVHCNTGVGVEATRQFVRDTCQRYGWKLIEVRAKEDCGQDYEQIVMAEGFPGPAQHGVMYSLLKERCLRWVERNHRTYYRGVNRHGRNCRRRRPVLYVSGARSEESVRRMGHVTPLAMDGIRVWVNIHHDQSAEDQRRYMIQNGLQRNPVRDALCMSGECLCGAYASKPELDELLHAVGDDPGVQRLLKIRAKVIERFPWDWDEGPPAWWLERNRGQSLMFDMTPPHRQFLCVGCNKRQEVAEEQFEVESRRVSQVLRRERERALRATAPSEPRRMK